MRLTACALIAAAHVALTAQDAPSPLFAALTIADYLGETYTHVPVNQSNYVFFEREPISIDVTVANQTAVDEILTLSPLKQNALFALTATRNGDVYPLRFQIAAPQKRSVGAATAIDDLAGPLNLRSKERLDWRVSIEADYQQGFIKSPSSQMVRIATSGG